MPEVKPEVKPADWAHLLPPIFARCVDPEAVRYGFQSPFVQDRWIYATDGRIIVRKPWFEPWPHQSEGRTPNDLDKWIFVGIESQSDPVSAPMPEGDCKACLGAKALKERGCPNCRGKGRTACGCNCLHCHRTEECGDCDGKGRLGPGPCDECESSGILDHRDSIELAPGCLIARRYAALLHEQGAELYPPSASDEHRVRFWIGEIEGVLMGMSAEE